MQILNPVLDLERFFLHLERSRERVLLLDYDGTLAPFEARPERARPYPRVGAILKQIDAKASTRVVVVTGRRLAELRARGRNEGDVVSEVLGTCSPDAAVACLGDDTTDEDACAAIAGRGVAVRVCSERRSSQADLCLAPPHELIAFLEKWLAAGAAH